MTGDEIERIRARLRYDYAGCEPYAAMGDGRVLLAALDASRAESATLRDRARREAIEACIAECQRVETVGLVDGATYCAALLRAMLDAPVDDPPR